MKQALSALALAAALSFAGAPASAAPVSTTFSGSVGGYWSLDILSDDFPLGTAVSYSFTYDDAFAEVGAALSVGMTQAISGWLQVGSAHIDLHTLRLTSYAFNAGNPNGINHFGFQVQGDGADTDDGEPFSGLWIYMGTDGHSAFGSGQVSYGNTNGFVVDNGFLLLQGSTSFADAPAATVPAPPTLLLAGTMLGALALTRRRGAR
jgi:hypothetical protein